MKLALIYLLSFKSFLACILPCFFSNKAPAPAVVTLLSNSNKTFFAASKITTTVPDIVVATPTR